MSLLRQGKAGMLTIYLGESDQWHGSSLYVAIVQLVREQGGAGATVTRAVAGYGVGSRLHEQKGVRLASDAPLIITVIDQPARLHRLIPRLQEMIHGGLMTLQEIEVLKYTHARRQGVASSLPVRQIMETNVIVVQMQTPVATIVERLLAAPFRVLPVVDDRHHLQGIISTGDLIRADLLPLRRGIVRTAQELDPHTVEVMDTSLEKARRSTLKAQDIMNRQVQTLRPDQTLREVAHLLLETHLRNLPVVDADGTVRGMVTRADVLQTIRTTPLMSPHASSATQPLHVNTLPEGAVQQQPVSLYTNHEVTTVGEQTPLAEVIDELILSPLKRVIVLDSHHHVSGIISDVDVLTSLGDEARPRFLAFLSNWTRGKPTNMPKGIVSPVPGRPQVAADVMNHHVVTIVGTETVQEAIERMMTTHRKILPVLDAEQRLVGTIGRFDVLRILLEQEISSEKSEKYLIEKDFDSSRRRHTERS